MLNSFLDGAMHAIGGYAVYGLAFLFSILIMRFISRNKKDVAYAQIAITILKDTLGKKLGPKADAVFDAWSNAITEVSNGDAVTKEEMADEFVTFVKLATKDKFVLTDDEIASIHEAAVITINMIHVNSKPTQIAVQAMMSQSK